MAEVSTPLPFDPDLHFVVKSGGRLYVTMGAYVYDPEQPNMTSEESAAISYLEDRIGSGDFALLDPSTANTGSFILFCE